MAIKILIVDDSHDTTWLLRRTLTEESYEVEIAHSGLEGLRLAYNLRPDLILLDVMMPDMDGWTTLHRLREFSEVPVVMLTAVGGEESLVQGLDSGADDYVTKPFGMEELKARIRAVLRRRGLADSDRSSSLKFDGGQLIIDPSSQEVIVRGEMISLTPTEYRLLLCLAYNAGRVLTADQILDNVWGPGYEDSPSNVKLYIWYLRRKIEIDPGQPRYGLTKRGTGYYLADI
ncbi:MAG TPA: response regulator transcription factor [Anaerolineae bacterium]|nr:response regulator transcription factor [Anaerolineae bacterium]